jgi:glycine betaine/proline transport system substrate-binding protein
MDVKGVPDIAPELWTQSVAVPLKAAIAAGSLHSMNPMPILGAGEGWVVPDYTLANHPELKTVLDVIDHPEFFPYNEDPSKGAFISCPAGWGCQQINNNLFTAFDMEAKGWVLVDPGSAAGLDGAMAKAVQRGDDYFGYYWSPTAMMGKYNMQMLDFGVPFQGMDVWTSCTTQAECADPQPTAWSVSEINTIVTDSFMKNNDPKATAYIKARSYPADAMGAMLVYMADNQAGGNDTAIEFLVNHEDVWTQWVGVQAANLIKKSLK